MKTKKNLLIGGAILFVVIVVMFTLKGEAGNENSKKAASSNSVDQLANVSLGDETESQSNFQGTGDLKTYDFTEAPKHIGENAKVTGTVYKVTTAKSGVTFLDFCKSFSACPFSSVIFASDLDKFPNHDKLIGKIAITGIIKSYQGKAEIILNDPSQLE